MLALLRDIAAQAPESMYQGDARIRALSAELSESAVESRYAVLAELGVAEMLYGRELEALAHLEEARAELPAEASNDERARLLHALGVASLRLAETENCCRRPTAESCILPLQGGAIHARRAGSTAAIEYFTELLTLLTEDAPERGLALWLLNLAYMTLDRYPEDVPPALRIDPARLRSDVPFPRFPNVAGELGLDTDSLSGGVVVDDLDMDGDFDVLRSTHDVTFALRLFVNEGHGTFREGAEAAGLAGLFGGLNMVQADYDDDGSVDVLVLRGAWLKERGRHPKSLLRNTGDPRVGPCFTDTTFAAGLGEPCFPTQTAAWADYDRDGDLDVFVGNETTPGLQAPCQLFRNEGGPDGSVRFQDVAPAAGVTNLRFTKGVVFGDYDQDGDPDLYVSNYGEENRLYRNDAGGTFEDVACTLRVQRPVSSFPTWFWDYDNDGALDLFAPYYATAAAEVAAYYAGTGAPRRAASGFFHNRGDGTFEDVGQEVGLGRPMNPMGCNFGDLDNDGFLDFYLGTGSPDFASLFPNLMFWNDGGRRFRDVTLAGGFGHLQKGHAIAFADLDQDGDQDVFAHMGGAYRGDHYPDALFRNPGFAQRWIGLRLVGTRSNRSGIGARIALTCEGPEGERTIYRHVSSGGSFGASPLEQHIGLGDARRVVQVAVTWPATGDTLFLHDLPLDRRLTITEGADGFALRPCD